MSDFQRMGGTCSLSEEKEGHTVVSGELALSQIGNYATTFHGYTGGRGQYEQSFLGYRTCVQSAQVISSGKHGGTLQDKGEGSSIFCKNGAGYTVSWEEVPQHMHCTSKLPKFTDEGENLPPLVLRQRSQQFANSLAEDKALLEIFQRTYGKISPDKIRRPSPSRQVLPPPQKRKPPFLLVDGYNIIFAWADLEDLARDSLDLARSELLNILSNYQGFYGGHVMAVFDAYRVKNGVGSVEQWHNITLVFTREAETADMYIEKVSHQLASDFQVRVASSDRLEQMIILGQGGLRLSAKGFYQEVQQMNEAMKKFLS